MVRERPKLCKEMNVYVQVDVFGLEFLETSTAFEMLFLRSPPPQNVTNSKSK